MIHPSLLPKYRGAAPVHHALLNGDTHTGVSIVEIRKKGFDNGDIIMQNSIPIDRAETYASLSLRLSQLSSNMVNTLLDGNYLDHKVTQDESMMSYAPKFDRDANVYRLAERKERTVSSFYNMYRAFKGSSLKAAKLIYDGKHVFVDDCCLLSDLTFEEHQKEYIEKLFSLLSSGTVFIFNNIKKLRGKLVVRFDDGWLVIERLHFADGQTMAGKNFVKLLEAESEYGKAVLDINAGNPIAANLIKFE